jgi:hypothetical protein
MRIREAAAASAALLWARLSAVYGLTDPRLVGEFRAHILATLLGFAVPSPRPESGGADETAGAGGAMGE